MQPPMGQRQTSIIPGPGAAQQFSNNLMRWHTARRLASEFHIIFNKIIATYFIAIARKRPNAAPNSLSLSPLRRSAPRYRAINCNAASAMILALSTSSWMPTYSSGWWAKSKMPGP